MIVQILIRHLTMEVQGCRLVPKESLEIIMCVRELFKIDKNILQAGSRLHEKS